MQPLFAIIYLRSYSTRSVLRGRLQCGAEGHANKLSGKNGGVREGTVFHVVTKCDKRHAELNTPAPIGAIAQTRTRPYNCSVAYATTFTHACAVT